jgi:hypothetical protein
MSTLVVIEAFARRHIKNSETVNVLVVLFKLRSPVKLWMVSPHIETKMIRNEPVIYRVVDIILQSINI